MRLTIAGIDSGFVDEVRRGGADAHGQPAVLRIAEGPANPCRHCLELIRPGDEKLVLAYRPFGTLQPYAEVGPVFLHRRACERYAGRSVPAWFAFLDPAIVRGYDREDWILYETGAVVRGTDVQAACEKILSDEAVAYVHVRSKFNCFQCRVDRAPSDGPDSRTRAQPATEIP
jgi:Protein of unknown function (DUF1203)